MPVSPGVAGQIFIFSYWYEGLSGWVNIDLREPWTPPVIPLPLGKVLYLMIWWLNTGTISWQGHIALTITKPDGVKVIMWAKFNQDKSAVPGDGWGVQFGDSAALVGLKGGITLELEGTYRGEAVLSQLTALIERGSFTIRLINTPSWATNYNVVWADYKGWNIGAGAWLPNAVTLTDVPLRGQLMVILSSSPPGEELPQQEDYPGIRKYRPLEAKDGATYVLDWARKELSIL